MVNLRQERTECGYFVWDLGSYVKCLFGNNEDPDDSNLDLM